MTELVPTGRLGLYSVADTTLKAMARVWFLVAVTGQLVFVYYVAAVYGAPAVQGDFEAWNKILPHGYVAGDTIGNFAVGMHLFLAVVIIGSGALQLIPQVRTHAPSFHHWNGRIYILTAFLLSIGGLYMVWTRGTTGGVVGEVAISLNAVLIMLCAAMALRFALARNFTIHRRWALRLFMVVSGVWFFRIGLMLWLMINNGPVGFDPETFQGPFLTFLAFAQYLVPLAVLEVYLRTQERADALGRFTMAAALSILTVAMAGGIFAATMGMWLPSI